MEPAVATLTPAIAAVAPLITSPVLNVFDALFVHNVDRTYCLTYAVLKQQLFMLGENNLVHHILTMDYDAFNVRYAGLCYQSRFLTNSECHVYCNFNTVAFDVIMNKLQSNPYNLIEVYRNNWRDVEEVRALATHLGLTQLVEEAQRTMPTPEAEAIAVKLIAAAVIMGLSTTCKDNNNFTTIKNSINDLCERNKDEIIRRFIRPSYHEENSKLLHDIIIQMVLFFMKI